MVTITHLVINGQEYPVDIKRPAEEYTSANFKWRELADRSTMTLKFSPDLLKLVQYVRTKKNWVIDTTQGLSWYRTAEFNQQIGGVPTSQHIRGLATDLKCWTDKVGGKQVHPIYVAYEFEKAFNRLGYIGCIGTYMPGYTKGSNGYNHIDIRQDKVLYVCYKKGILENITDISQVSL